MKLKIFFPICLLLTISCSTNYKNIESAKTNVSTINENSAAELKKKEKVDYFSHLKPKHQKVLKEYVKNKNYLRPAKEEVDSGIYSDSPKWVRETVGENGNQYYAVGDMNQDGREDFAVLLVDTREVKEDEGGYDFFVLAIFNSPFRENQKPNYLEEKLVGYSNSYIEYGKMTEKHLFLGKFESDVYCASYYPKKKTYYSKGCLDGE